jgi:hypothetical protein
VMVSVTGSNNAFSIVCQIAMQCNAKQSKAKQSGAKARGGEGGRGEERETSEPRDRFEPSAGPLRRPPALRGVDR